MSIGNVVFSWRYPAQEGYLQLSLDGEHYWNKQTLRPPQESWGYLAFNLNGAVARYVRLYFTKWQYQSAEVRDFELYPYVFPTPYTAE